MKRIIYKLILCLSILSFASCVSEDVGQETVGNDAIVLELNTGAIDSRAVETVNEAHEYVLSHLDVFIFTTEGNKFHYERIAVSDAPTGTVTLSKKKSDFGQNVSYSVYVIANSSASRDEMSVINSLTELKEKTQTDTNIHLSGLDLDNVPKYFLMDGIAFKGNDGPNTPAEIEIKDGSPAGTVVLKVNLRRAAAKVEILLNAGDNVTFFRHNDVGYYLRNVPTVTTLLAEESLAKDAQQLVTTSKTVSAYSKGKYMGETYGETEYTGNGELRIVAYVYKHSWAGGNNETENFLNNGTSLVVNIPLVYNDVKHEQSYYQIELGKDKSFERNHYYKLIGNINAPGAEEYTEPIPVDDMKYSAYEWENVGVAVGGESKPQFLKVNKEILRIYNQSIDETLEFASSSPITITVYGEVTETNGNLTGSGMPYYYNKYSVKTNVGTTIKNAMNAESVVSGALSGNIQVNSPIPENKTIRYFTLLIENEEGMTEKVLVEQYPVIYVTNQLGWYSYRDDFGGTTFQNKATGVVSIGLDSRLTTPWNGQYDYNTTRANPSGNGNDDVDFFTSKVVTSNNTTGQTKVAYYYWNGNSVKTDGAGDNNARMYHIHVTATSPTYTVGRPRMTTAGYTDPGEDNAKLVSPSFMIASRLGFISGTTVDKQSDEVGLRIYNEHCKNYVEVYKDENGEPVVLDNWRLPTAAELQIIVDYQGASGVDADAIDFLLNAHQYMSANGYVVNSKHTLNTGSKAGRCVRDAYKK